MVISRQPSMMVNQQAVIVVVDVMGGGDHWEGGAVTDGRTSQVPGDYSEGNVWG